MGIRIGSLELDWPGRKGKVWGLGVGQCGWYSIVDEEGAKAEVTVVD